MGNKGSTGRTGLGFIYHILCSHMNEVITYINDEEENNNSFNLDMSLSEISLGKDFLTEIDSRNPFGSLVNFVEAS